MTEFRHFDVEQTESATVLRLRDPRLADTLLISELHDELLEFVETRQPRRLIIDFGRVRSCTTAVINSALRAKKRLADRHGRLLLCNMRKVVRDAFRLLNLDGTVFTICDTAEEAQRRAAESD